MHVGGQREGLCSICGVDVVEGDGVGACDVHEECEPGFLQTLQDTALGKALGGGTSTSRRLPLKAEGTPSPATTTRRRQQSPDLFPTASPPFPPSSFSASPTSYTSSSSPLTRRALAAAAAAESEDIPSTPPRAEARYILLARLDVTTRILNESLDTSLLKEALSSALGADVDDPYHQVLGKDAMQTEVYSLAVDEMFAAMYPKELGDEGGYTYRVRRRRHLSPTEEAGTEGGGEDEEEEVALQVQKHQIVLTSISRPQTRRALRALGVRDPVVGGSRHLRLATGEKDRRERAALARETARRRLQADMEAVQDDPVAFAAAATAAAEAEKAAEAEEAALGLAIAKYLQEKGGAVEASVENVDVHFDQTLYIPAYDPDVFANESPFYQDVGAYSVDLLDPDLPLLPLDHLGYKKNYHLTLRNFPALARVQLVGLRVAPSEEVRHQAGGQLPWRCPLGMVKTDDQGFAMLPDLRIVSPLACPPGDYQIRATVLSVEDKSEEGHGGILYGMSNVFALSREGRKRKLYGTSMWL
jgi:hypothetical protein